MVDRQAPFKRVQTANIPANRAKRTAHRERSWECPDGLAELFRFIACIYSLAHSAVTMTRHESCLRHRHAVLSHPGLPIGRTPLPKYRERFGHRPMKLRSEKTDISATGHMNEDGPI